jgi:Fusaric acid resistance protein-like
MRAARAMVVMPGLFAFTFEVIGNLQMATFAAFGSFATLVLASFGATRRDKLIAHACLAVAGSVLLTIGTAVNSSILLAAVVTVPVTFAVFFAGIIGPNAASGVTAGLLPYVLPAASPGTMAMVPDRLAGWWMASVVGTAAVLAMSRPSPGDRLRGTASKLASKLAAELDDVLRGEATGEQLSASIEAKHELLAQFTATPFRPTGVATADQALANAVELLEWCTSLLVDSVRERSDLSGAAPSERELLQAAVDVLRDAGTLLGGGDARPDLERLEQLRVLSLCRLHQLTPDGDDFRSQAQISFHAHAISVTILAIGADAEVAARVADPRRMAEEGSRWFGGSTFDPATSRRQAVSEFAGFALRNASVRSVWFVNSLRGSLALAAAVAVADLSSVQHGFWVVLGTLSVLRTNAASTGSTALRALVGTLAGFVIGAALIQVIGTGSSALWVALPIAVFVAAYSPGTAPFAVGQAAFTVTVAVLFNLLVPVGPGVVVVRIEDVAIGCAVSLVVGALFWPRGVASVVGDDLADAFRSGAMYLTQAVEWASGARALAPDGALGAVTAGQRLDDALRGLMAEQGTKNISKQELWHLVGGSLRLRLTAHAVAGLPRDDGGESGVTIEVLGRRTAILQAWYDRLAAQVDRPRGRAVDTLVPPTLDGFDGIEKLVHSPHALWLCEHLDHLTEHLVELVRPAERVAEIRRRPWWR